MNVQKLHNLNHWLEYSSFRVNTEKHVLLSNSLLVLQNENHFKNIFFWGIVQCSESDYYIAFGYSSDAIRERTFFYSEDCQNWKLLPVPEKRHLILAELCQRPFQGDPGLVIEVVDDAPLEELFPDDENIDPESTDAVGVEKTTEEVRSADEQIVQEKTALQQTQSKEDVEEPPITSGELKEEDRLAATVHIISDEASVVPRGGLFKQTDGASVHSRAFEGLGVEEADEMSSFQHYREPRLDWNTNLLIREDYNYALDSLDTVDKDLPSDCWSAQLVEGDRTIILSTLAWPGFMFFHHLNTPFYGSIYVGTGQRNLDIPFMTQVKEGEVVETESGAAAGEPSLIGATSKEPSLAHKQSHSIASKGQSQIENQSVQRSAEEEIITSA